jgi:mRNA-degrading endonuclease toxin of MazEF toxin-antitoxin module
MIQRGDVVVVRFPYAGGGGSKVRPAIVVQCDRLNRLTRNTVVAMIPGNTRLVGSGPAQFLIDPADPDGASAGLSFPPAAKCDNLATVPQPDIINTLGHLSDVLKQKLDNSLKAALELP